MSMKAVIALTEHLGDIVACEPIARRLKAKGFHVTWVVLEKYRALLDANPHVDEVRVVSCLSEWAAIPYEKEYNLVADLHFDQRVCGVTKKPVTKRTGDKSVGLDNYLDHPSLLAAFCASAGLPTLDDAPVVHTNKGPHPLGGKRYAVFHCTANEEEREWRHETWRMLAQDALSEGLPVMEVGGRPMMEGVKGVINLTGILPIPKLVDAIRHCALFVGCESGPAHIAGALCKQSIILRGRYRGRDDYNMWTGFLRDNKDACVLSHRGPTRELPYTLAREMLLAKIDKLAKA